MHEGQACYCIHIRVTLGEGGGDQPPPSHAWSSLIADMFQQGFDEQITEAVVLAPREAILFFLMIIMQGRVPLEKCKGFRIELDGPHQLGW